MVRSLGMASADGSRIRESSRVGPEALRAPSFALTASQVGGSPARSLTRRLAPPVAAWPIRRTHLCRVWPQTRTKSGVVWRFTTANSPMAIRSNSAYMTHSVRKLTDRTDHPALDLSTSNERKGMNSAEASGRSLTATRYVRLHFAEDSMENSAAMTLLDMRYRADGADGEDCGLTGDALPVE